jgi:hypothetical protein
VAFIFDGETRIITLTSGTISVSLVDLYSKWKEWVRTNNNSKYFQAFGTVGGDPIDIVAGTRVPLYLFLLNGWRIRPQAANHTLSVSLGILLVLGGGDPFLDPVGSFTVRILFQQPVQAIGYTINGGSGSTPEQNAAAVLAAMNITPPDVNIKKVNGYTIDGTGTTSDPWGPV